MKKCFSNIIKVCNVPYRESNSIDWLTDLVGEYVILDQYGQYLKSPRRWLYGSQWMNYLADADYFKSIKDAEKRLLSVRDFSSKYYQKVE